MGHLSKRLRYYYLYGLIPAGLLQLLLWWWGVHVVNVLISALGLVWPYCLRAPGVAERVQMRAYRYSFLRLAWRCHRTLGRTSPLLADLAPPLLMGLGLALITPFAHPAFAALGYACWWPLPTLGRRFQRGVW